MNPKTLLLAAALSLPSLPAAAQVLVPTDPSLAPLAIKSQRVSVEVKDQLARTHIEQVFVSHVDRPLEATYVFPIPDGVAVSEFALWMNGKKVVGEVLEADKARSIYEGIVSRMRDPGLLEYAGQRLLRCRVFPVPARGEQKIEIEYGELTKIEGGIGRYTYPLATGGKSTRVKDDLSLRLSLASKVDLKSIYSPTHKVSVDRKDDKHALVGFEETGAMLDRDFDLFYTVSEKDVGLNLLTFKDARGDDGYFVVMLAPKTEIAASEILPKDVVFVFDSSGSMDGAKMEKAKEAMRYVLGTLNPKDRFNIVRFSTGTETYAGGMVTASKDEIEKARKFVADMVAAGGTAIDDALTDAFKLVKPAEGRPAMIVFMTDGEPTIGETDPEAILRNARKNAPDGVRVFSFGVGTELNAVLLDRLSAELRGTPEYATADEEIEVKISSFAEKINNPVMTDLEIDFGKMAVYDVYPRTIPDLFKGGQVTVFGRYKSSGASALTLKGRVQGKRESLVYEGTFTRKEGDDGDATSFIPRLWATRKVGYLLDEIRAKGEKTELRDEVISLARKWGIMTPYTSYLVVEDTPLATVMPAPRPAPEPDFSRSEGKSVARRDAAGPRGRKGSGAGAPAASAPMPQEESRMAESLGAGDDWDAYEPSPSTVGEKSGAAGVVVSRKVKDKREKEVLDSGATANVMRAGGKTFVWTRGAWVDTAFTGSEKTVKVKYLSEAWFAIVRAHPEVREALSVGGRVILVTAKGKAVIVAEDGVEKLSESEIGKYF